MEYIVPHNLVTKVRKEFFGCYPPNNIEPIEKALHESLTSYLNFIRHHKEPSFMTVELDPDVIMYNTFGDLYPANIKGYGVALPAHAISREIADYFEKVHGIKHGLGSGKIAGNIGEYLKVVEEYYDQLINDTNFPAPIKDRIYHWIMLS